MVKRLNGWNAAVRVGFFTFVLAVTAVASGQETSSILPASDREFLLGLIGNPLVDPQGKTLVQIEVDAANRRGDVKPRPIFGWLDTARWGFYRLRTRRDFVPGAGAARLMLCRPAGAFTVCGRFAN